MKARNVIDASGVRIGGSWARIGVPGAKIGGYRVKIGALGPRLGAQWLGLRPLGSRLGHDKGIMEQYRGIWGQDW